MSATSGALLPADAPWKIAGVTLLTAMIAGAAAWDVMKHYRHA